MNNPDILTNLTRKKVLERYDLIAPAFEKAMAQVMGIGAEIHGDEDYLSGKNTRDRSPINHAKAHINAYLGQELYDKPEIGTDYVYHLIGAACNLLMEYEIIMHMRSQFDEDYFEEMEEPPQMSLDLQLPFEDDLPAEVIPPATQEEAEDLTAQILERIEPTDSDHTNKTTKIWDFFKKFTPGK